MLRVESYFHKEETLQVILRENTSFRKATSTALVEDELQVPVPGRFHRAELRDHTDRKLNRACPDFLLLIN